MEQIRGVKGERDHLKVLVSKHHAKEMVLSYNVHVIYIYNKHLSQVCVFLYARHSETHASNSLLKRTTLNIA